MATLPPGLASSSASFRKRIVRTLRFLLVLAVVGAAYPAARAGDLSWRFWLAAGLLGLSNLAYHLDRHDALDRLRVSAALFLFDTLLLAYMMYELGERSRDFFVLYALTVLMAASGRGVAGAFVNTAAVTALYVLLAAHGRTDAVFLSAAFFTRVSLFFVLSIFVAFLARQAEEAQAEAGRNAGLYRALFDAGPACILLCDAAGRIVAANRRAEAALGYGPGELEGRDVAGLTDLPGRWRTVADAPGTDREAETVGLEFRRKDGSTVCARAALGAIPGKEGAILQVVAQVE